MENEGTYTHTLLTRKEKKKKATNKACQKKQTPHPGHTQLKNAPNNAKSDAEVQEEGRKEEKRVQIFMKLSVNLSFYYNTSHS